MDSVQHSLFRYARWVPRSTVAYVSARPPLIPDGRISRVRLAVNDGKLISPASLPMDAAPQVLAHIRPSRLCPAGITLDGAVFAGCCEPLLEPGPSRRYLCASFPTCLAPYPGGSWGALARFFPHDIGLPPVRTRSAPTRPVQRPQHGRYFGAAVILLWTVTRRIVGVTLWLGCQFKVQPMSPYVFVTYLPDRLCGHRTTLIAGARPSDWSATVITTRTKTATATIAQIRFRGTRLAAAPSTAPASPNSTV